MSASKIDFLPIVLLLFIIIIMKCKPAYIVIFDIYSLMKNIMNLEHEKWVLGREKKKEE